MITPLPCSGPRSPGRCRPGSHARAALLALAVLTFAGCWIGARGEGDDLPSSGSPEADQRASQRAGATRQRPLYERLGADSGIRALVDDFTARVIADPRVNFERKDIRPHWYSAKTQPWHPTPEAVENFKKHMTEFLALAAGGPSRYAGRDIQEVHADMKITNTEFDAMIGDIKASMDKLNIAPREQRDILAIFETTRKQVVTKP